MMTTISTLETDVSQLFENGLYDEAINTIESHIFVNHPEEIFIPKPIHLKILLTLSILPAAHIPSPGRQDLTTTSQSSLALRALSVLSSLLSILKNRESSEDDTLSLALENLLDIPNTPRKYFQKAKDKDLAPQDDINPFSSDSSLGFSDDESDNDSFDDTKDSDEIESQLIPVLKPEQLLFSWDSHVRSWDLLEWMLLYSTVPTEFHQKRWRQLEPVFSYILDLLIYNSTLTDQDPSHNLALKWIRYNSSLASRVCCHWTTSNFILLKKNFSDYLTSAEQSQSIKLPDLERMPPSSGIDLTATLYLRIPLMRLISETLTLINLRSVDSFELICSSLLRQLSIPSKQVLLCKPDPFLLKIFQKSWKPDFKFKIDMTEDSIANLLISTPSFKESVNSYHALQDHCIIILFILVTYLTDSNNPVLPSSLFNIYITGKELRVSWLDKYQTSVDNTELKVYTSLENRIYAILISELSDQ